MTDVPRITIDNVDDIRILICYLIYSLGCPLTKNQLIEITSLEQAVNYFDLSAALSTIGERLCTVSEIDGVPLYSNTRLGVKAAKEFSDKLPASVREKMFGEAVRIYTRDAIKRDAAVSVKTSRNSDDTLNVGVTIFDPKSGRAKYYLSVLAESNEEAERIKEKARSRRFKEYLDDYFKAQSPL